MKITIFALMLTGLWSESSNLIRYRETSTYLYRMDRNFIYFTKIPKIGSHVNLPNNFHCINHNGKQYCTYSGVYFVADTNGKYKVVKNPIDVSNKTLDELPDNSWRVFIDDQKYYVIVSPHREGSYYVRSEGVYRRVQPPAGSYVHVLPLGYQTVFSGLYTYAGVHYVPNTINGFLVYSAVEPLYVEEFEGM